MPIHELVAYNDNVIGKVNNWGSYTKMSFHKDLQASRPHL